MSDPLYSREILRLAADAHGAGRLQSADATGTAFNPACGDRVTMDIVTQEGAIVQIAQETKACVLAQASASILGQNAPHANRDDIERLRREISAMLAKQGAGPQDPFQPYRHFAGALQYASRHRCVLLPVEALLDAFDRLER